MKRETMMAVAILLVAMLFAGVTLGFGLGHRFATNRQVAYLEQLSTEVETLKAQPTFSGEVLIGVEDQGIRVGLTEREPMNGEIWFTAAEHGLFMNNWLILQEEAGIEEPESVEMYADLTHNRR